MIRVLVADDEAMVRAGVCAILSSDPDIEVVGEASNGRDAIELARRLRPDVTIVDIRMPGLDGIATATEIRVVTPQTEVVMLTTFGEDANISRALEAGVAGFLLKAADPRELLTAVHAAVDGAAYLSPAVAKRVIAHLHKGDLARHDAAEASIAALSDREREVLGLLGAGLSNAEIAARIFVVEGTVKGYVSTILSRLGARNRVQAAIIAYEAGLVTSAPPRRP